MGRFEMYRDMSGDEDSLSDKEFFEKLEGFGLTEDQALNFVEFYGNEVDGMDDDELKREVKRFLSVIETK